MLEETADEGAHADVLAQSLNTGYEAADPADDEVDLHAGGGGRVEALDGGAVHQAVHLGDDARGLAEAGGGGLGGDEDLDLFVEVVGRDEQVLEPGLAHEPGEGVEEVGHFGGERVARGEQAEVGVDARGLGIVVTGAEVGVVPHSSLLVAHDQATLAVDLQADDSVDDVHAGLLELAGPLDVVGLVEAGLELDQGGDLLAVLRGLHEGVDDRGVAAGAIQRLFDGENAGIAGGLLHEGHDRIEGIVGVVEEDVALVEGGEDVLPGEGNRARVRGEGRILQGGSVDEIVDAHQAQQIQRPVDTENVLAGQAEVVGEAVEGELVHAILDFQAHGGAAAQVAQLVLDALEEIFGLLLVDVEVAVAGDAEGEGAVDTVAGEELVGAELDDFAEEDEPFRAAGRGGDLHHAREDPGHGQDGEEPLVLRRGGVVDRDDDVERLVAQLGEGMRGIDGQRGEDRIHLGAEVAAHPGELGAGELGPGLEDEVLALEGGQEMVAPAAVLLLDDRCHHEMDAAELFAGAEAVEAGVDDAGIHLLDEAGHADLEELVQVGADDGEELEPLQEWMVGVPGLLEHAAVEGQPAQLAVEKQSLGRHRWRGRGFGRFAWAWHRWRARKLGGRPGKAKRKPRGGGRSSPDCNNERMGDDGAEGHCRAGIRAVAREALR